MTALNPPLGLTNAGATHTAQVMRYAVSGWIGGNATGLMRQRSGIVRGLGNSLVVAVSSGLTVSVGSGVAYVAGTTDNRQGCYVCVNESPINVTLDAAHGSFNRIDSIVLRVYDSEYAGASNMWAIEKVTGTASSSPVAPTVPASSTLIANITVVAGDTTLASGDIADLRPYLPNGIVEVTSIDNLPVANDRYSGMLIWDRTNGVTGVGAMRRWDATNSNWNYLTPGPWTSLSGVLAAGWQTAGHGFQPAWRWIGPRTAELRGVVGRISTPATDGMTVLTLPTDPRPAQVVQGVLASQLIANGGHVVHCAINPSGAITISFANVGSTTYVPTWVSLDGLRYDTI
jgi:hypothetical protein